MACCLEDNGKTANPPGEHTMATVPSSLSSPFVTFGHVVASLPDIPLSRIRVAPLPGTATEADVLAVRNKDKSLCELIDGVLVEKAMGAYESLLALEIATLLKAFVKQHDLGVVLGADGMLRLTASQVRIPDACFIAWARLPGRVFPRQPIPLLCPDLAVEVLSESNTRAEMQRKLADYFNAGTQLVWYLDPQRREMSVYTSPSQCRIVGIEEVLDGGNLLPHLALRVADIFTVPMAGEES